MYSSNAGREKIEQLLHKQSQPWSQDKARPEMFSLTATIVEDQSASPTFKDIRLEVSYPNSFVTFGSRPVGFRTALSRRTGGWVVPA